ncbi:MAG TPA: ectoine hydroxylase [Polyangiales bacterium]|nr:ectoine hydroxylase [Polyangiales bacterium]
MSATPDLYPSRNGSQGGVLPRQDPVIADPHAPGPLTPPQLLRYQQDGYLQCQGMFTPEEVALVQGAVAGLCAAEHVLAKPETILEPSGKAVRSIFAAHAFEPQLARLVRDPRLLGVARQILGSEVYIHQCRINYKPAFRGKEFYWHSDFETWHVEDGLPRMRALTVAINLTENSEFNGPLMVIPGSHRQYVSCAGETPENHVRDSLRRQQYGTPEHAQISALVHESGIAAPKGPAGSLVIFDCNLMHGSGANITPHARCNLFVVYNSMQNVPQQPYSGQPPRPDYIASRQPEPLLST